MFEDYEDRIEYAKTKHLRMLERFHVGDTVYVLYSPTLQNWGVVVDIDIPTRKIYVDFNGVVRQFDPEWLIQANPELRTNNQPKGTTRVRASSLNKQSYHNMIVRVADSVKKTDVFEMEDKADILAYFQKLAQKHTGIGIVESENPRKVKLADFYNELQKKGFYVEVTMVSNSVFDNKYDVTNSFFISFQNNHSKSIVLKCKLKLTKLRAEDDSFVYDFSIVFI